MDGILKRFISFSIPTRFVSSLLESGEGAWVGLNDRRTESDYIWNNDINDHASYFSWAEDEPSNTNEKCNIENCVEMEYPNLKWNDMVCNGYNSYVCELKKSNTNGNSSTLKFFAFKDYLFAFCFESSPVFVGVNLCLLSCSYVILVVLWWKVLSIFP
jgi:hypothetical protein